MKLLRLVCQSRFFEEVDALLEEAGVESFLAVRSAVGRDPEDRREGTRVYPGHLSLFEIPLEDHHLERLLRIVSDFRNADAAHAHLRAQVLPVERSIPNVDE